MDLVAVFQAFAAGVLSFFAPCSVAMLPAYMSYYLGLPGPGLGPERDADARTRRHVAVAIGAAVLGLALILAGLLDVRRVGAGLSRLGPQQFLLVGAGTALVLAGGLEAARRPAARGARLGLLTAAGLLGVFAVLGVPLYGILRIVSFELQSIVVLVIAMGMVILGVLGLVGKDVRLTLPVRAPMGRDNASFVAFGAAYGLVAMGCNLPLFLLAAIGPIVRDADPATGILALLAYGAGMALLLLALSVALGVSQAVVQDHLRKLVPPMRVAGHVVLILAGAYIAWYDWTVLR